MRNMPQLQPGQRSIQMTSSFYGYNHNKIISDGEMFDMMNMSGDYFPLLGLRKRRGISSYDIEGQAQVKLTGLHGRDQLVMVRGTQVYYNFTPVDGLTVSAAEADNPKVIVSFGAYVLIFPDRKYFNTVHMSDQGSIDRLFSIAGGSVSVAMCRADGTNYDMTQITVSTSAPSNPANGKLWIDQSGDEDVLRQYMAAAGEWLEVATTYVKISASGIGIGLSEYDTIELSGLEAVSSAGQKAKDQIAELNGSAIIYGCGDNYIIIMGLLSATQSALKSGTTVRADRKMPDLEYLCESNNRLWGCRYGWDSEKGEVINEIRASKLGDFKNWNSFMGLSTDSWAASVGTDGPFSGSAVQRGYPVFSKDGCFHKVSGNSPNSFTITTVMCRGIQEGSWRSAAVVNEAIYYKSRQDVMMFDGSMPVSISAQLGDIQYSEARAGVLGNKYYLCMKDKDDHWTLMNYDTKSGTWWKEDSSKVLDFAAVNDELFFIDEDENTLVSVTGSVGDPEEDFDWEAEFDLYGVSYRRESNYDDPSRVRNNKYVSMFKIRMELAEDAWMKLWIKYDNNEYEYMGERNGKQLRTFVLPVIPKRCDHVRYKITGHGWAQIYDISRMMEVGGDGN